MSGYDGPNFTPVPNLLIDEHIKKMGEAELRITLVIARQTFGWHKRRDRISLSQLVQKTGMSKQGVLNGITAGVERGTVIKTKSGNSFEYELVVNEVDQDTQGGQRSRLAVVNEVDQTSQRSRPKGVNEVDTQKKGNKLYKRKREGESNEGKGLNAEQTPPTAPPKQDPRIVTDDLPTPQPAPTPPSQTHTEDGHRINRKRKVLADYDPRKFVDGYTPAGKGATPYEVYRESFNRQLKKPAISLLSEQITDLGKWRAICAEYMLISDYGNVKNLLDIYQNGWRQNGWRDSKNGDKDSESDTVGIWTQWATHTSTQTEFDPDEFDF